MNNYFLLPLSILKFWYIESTVTLFGLFSSLNQAFLDLFSLPLFLRTFFKPLKNEYRQGLVGFSIAMGIVIKTFFILADLLIFAVMLTLELSVFVAFLGFPIFTVLLLFIH